MSPVRHHRHHRRHDYSSSISDEDNLRVSRHRGSSRHHPRERRGNPKKLPINLKFDGKTS